MSADSLLSSHTHVEGLIGNVRIAVISFDLRLTDGTLYTISHAFHSSEVNLIIAIEVILNGLKQPFCSLNSTHLVFDLSGVAVIKLYLTCCWV